MDNLTNQIKNLSLTLKQPGMAKRRRVQWKPSWRGAMGAAQIAAQKGYTQGKKAYDVYQKVNQHPQGKTVNRLAGGVTQHYDSKTTYVKKRPNRRVQRKKRQTRRLAKKLRRVNLPNHTLMENLLSTSVVVLGTTNYVQQWKVIQLFDTNDCADIAKHAAAIGGITLDPSIENAIAQSEDHRLNSARYFMKHVSWELTIVQQALPMTENTPMIVDIYYMQCRKNLTNDAQASLTALLNDDISGKAGAVISTDATTIGTDPSIYQTNATVTPYEHRELSKYFECYKKKQIQMNQGNVVTLSGIYHINKTLGKKNWYGLTANRGVTEFILISLRSADFNNAGNGTLGAQQLRLRRTFRYKCDPVNINPSSTINAL